MKIIIIDDDALISASLKIILENASSAQVAAMGCSGEEAISLYDQHLPDVMLMDIRMNGMTGLEAGEKILAKHPDARLLFLTTFNDDEYIVKALAMGAKGYIIKQDFESIAPALEAVMKGQSVFGSQVMDRIPELMNGSAKKKFDYSEYDINETEQDIIAKVAEGLSNKEIAQLLYLSEGTVRNYMSDIFLKLDVRDRTQLAIFYFNNVKC
ncbi:DNA-binding response regulator, NarL/FixJ family, contains REC and HTH domains [Ruminococcus sp. YE71]|uniref:response regulator n=1 Tax=unclassified Ruminococcus TaxID=2608920 RepID=UPI000889B459|nr:MULTISPECIES: response regulator transcription factor [unclassified Ruminococcus]SDA14654.1 DNA-binding response regulator, NarL/FixJ family, contains REC and HTH domains [Ruminococcus sp. YE78]SFW21291.1 DNA-binding response regulator, NarL/FixJ family, contains REC and HTH domains [Ruminococcus sp. YE71]